ncbi:helix-hairpin-helix domain-containing protein [Chlorobaculum sp. MV4-Y]|uniref:ComEA family DNA-binding protein n=1 Tax=Chlorobaculum sp. MV4-Y TaxID=2976335 RepID=UPI0021B06452|nr:helix-hairpin-helix domain-containing protein [Chlorobaculum sp. MV4-Y]UWX57328.1 helix-hairpin-helix domain-containing protein [Chlorobaculum sp. MV4-Y]
MKILDNLAVKLGVTRAEMTAVTLLTFFLLLGGALKYSGSVQDADKAIAKAETARYSEAEVDSLLALAMKPDDAVAAEPPGVAANDAEPEESATKSSARRTSKKQFSGTIVFRTASASQLQMIPGVGPVMAKRLIEFRKQNGGKVEHFNDFLKVKGVGKKKLELLQKHLTLN